MHFAPANQKSQLPIKWHNYIALNNTPAYLTHYTQYSILDPSQVQTPRLPFESGTAKFLEHAWQSNTIDHYTRFDPRFWRLDKYKTQDKSEQEISDILSGAIELPIGPQDSLPGLLGFSITGTDNIVINYAAHNGRPAYNTIFHENLHRRFSEMTEGEVRRAAGYALGDSFGQQVHNFGDHY